MICGGANIKQKKNHPKHLKQPKTQTRASDDDYGPE